MPVSVAWLDTNKTVLLQVIAGEWSLEDYYALSEQTNELLSSIDYRVDLIADLSRVRTVPGGMVSALRHSQVKNHPNLGLIIVGGLTNKFARAMYTMFVKLTPTLKHKFQLADSIEEAMTLLPAYEPVI